MTEIGNLSIWGGHPASIGIRRCWRWLGALLVVAALSAPGPVRADEPDDQYLGIVQTIQQADGLLAKNQKEAALAKYQEGQTALEKFQRLNPRWNSRVVAFRMEYVAGKVSELSEKAAPTDSGAGGISVAPAGAAGTQVKLVDPGAEPRRALRLQPKVGDKQSLALTMKVATETKMGEMQIPAMKLPAITMALDVSIKEVAENGDVTCEIVMTDASITEEPGMMPQIVDMMKKSFASVKGLSGTGVVSARGMRKKLEMATPADADPQTRQAIDQFKETLARLVAPLPEEPVGAGAKWEVSMPSKTQGLSLDETDTYEVSSLEGAQLNTKGTIVQHAAKQKIESPMAPGMKIDLDKFAGKGSRETAYDLTRLLPLTGKIDAHQEMSMSVNAAGQKQAILVKVDVAVTLESK